MSKSGYRSRTKEKQERERLSQFRPGEYHLGEQLYVGAISLYSLGATLYELLTGHVPFDEQDTLDLVFSYLAIQIARAVSTARLREQAKQAAVIDERNRLARDLHDSVTQTIFSANLIAETLPRLWESHPEEGRCGLHELHRLIQGALAEMRTLLLELRPAAIVEKKPGELLKQLTQTAA